MHNDLCNSRTSRIRLPLPPGACILLVPAEGLGHAAPVSDSINVHKYLNKHHYFNMENRKNNNK